MKYIYLRLSCVWDFGGINFILYRFDFCLLKVYFLKSEISLRIGHWACVGGWVKMCVSEQSLQDLPS